MRFFIWFTITIWSTFLTAAEVLTLKDGRQIQVNDDFTWHYLKATEEQKKGAVTVVQMYFLARQNIRTESLFFRFL